jgi:hypothetical protein
VILRVAFALFCGLLLSVSTARVHAQTAPVAPPPVSLFIGGVRAQTAATLVLSPDGMTVYDAANDVTWLADVNLPASNQFGLPVCTGPRDQVCVNSSGSMRYNAAVAWIAAMNASDYLGHADWRLPTTRTQDPSCGMTGPNGDSFGFDCMGSTLGSLYYNALGFTAPNTVLPIPNQSVGPFSNFQPYQYWSQTPGGATTEACRSAPSGCGVDSFSFNTGFQGTNTLPNFLYVLPSIPGSIAGAPPASGTGLQVNPGGQTVYDPVADRTWLADADLAASNSFGLPTCTDPTTPPACIAQDGAMTYAAASQFIANMNAVAYLGQTNWEIPPQDASCPAYGCGGNKDPMGSLYEQLGFSLGQPVVATPAIAVGPFQQLQPYLYWSCQGDTAQATCAPTGPVPNQEWSFSFGNGFTGTDILPNALYVTAYFPGGGVSTVSPVTDRLAKKARGTGKISVSRLAQTFLSAGGLRPVHTSVRSTPEPVSDSSDADVVKAGFERAEVRAERLGRFLTAGRD